MSVALDWYDQQHRAVIYRVTGHWTWEELRDTVSNLHNLADAAPGNIIMVIDISQSNILPPGNTVLNGQYMIRQLPEKISNIVVIIESSLIKTFMTMIFGMIPSWRNRMRFVKTVQEGQEVIDQLLAQITA